MSAEVKPGYMRTDAGVIPSDWQVVTIGDVASFSGGAQPPRETFIFDPKPGYIRLIQIRDYKSNDFVTYIPFSLAKKTCTSEDVMIGRYGPPIFQILRGLEGSYNVALIKTIPSSKLDREFWYYLLVQERLFKYIDLLSRRSSGQTGVEMSALKAYHIPLPPMKEQQAISSALIDVDVLISSLDQLISKKRDIQQATMQQLLTGHRRLPGFSGEWVVKRLGDHLSFLRNGTNPRAELSTEGDVHYLHYGDIHGSQHLLLNPAKISMPCLPRDKAKRLDRLNNGDLVFADASEDLDGVGKSAEVQLPEDMELVAGLHTIAVRFDKKVMTDGFKAYLQFIPTFRSHLRQLAAGTKVYATNRAHIASAELKIPGIEEQAAIATILSDMDAELAALEVRREKARQLKQGMMQELLTGRIRLA
ncbi:hypothetical protein C5609_16275 [Pseudomonas putida]|uniref:restriction endonuclease subunit S n=1 Tax=Pseudomonas putida TaxID=303 RepID=UPI00106F324A|nr:restriction endonuclease subunit S [Pseudomonas putida]TFF50865.1 hypothetical protein C5609_16275 [Pseudomonas putida]